jgi:hypothetical protein
MYDHTTLDCRLVFALDTPPERRREITEVIKTATFSRIGAVPKRVVWTFGSVLFSVKLSRRTIVESVITSVPPEALGDLVVNGRRVWRD